MLVTQNFPHLEFAVMIRDGHVNNGRLKAFGRYLFLYIFR
jgi:small nuclear ribonucleoprotein (snRNP)-like protein